VNKRYGDGSIGNVHPQLSQEIKAQLESLLDGQRDQCIRDAKAGGKCYDYGNVEIQLEGETSQLLRQLTDEIQYVTGVDTQTARAEAGVQYAESKGYLKPTCIKLYYALDAESPSPMTSTTKCTVSLETTGNAVVDAALQRIYTLDLTYAYDGKSLNGKSGSFLLDAIIGPLFSFEIECKTQFGDKCLPSDTRISLAHHFVKHLPPGYQKVPGFYAKDCFNIHKPSGFFNCVFDASPGTGLPAEVSKARALAGSPATSLASPASGAAPSSWVPTASQMLLPGKASYEVDDLQQLVNTLYVNLAHALLHDGAARSRAYVKPKPLAFYTDIGGGSGAFPWFQGMDIMKRREYERTIARQNFVGFSPCCHFVCSSGRLRAALTTHSTRLAGLRGRQPHHQVPRVRRQLPRAVQARGRRHAQASPPFLQRSDTFFSFPSRSGFFFSKNEKRDGSVQLISVPGIRRGVSIKPNLRNSETDHTDH
jgi:hypothetical protein